jgi:hypothetical protein
MSKPRWKAEVVYTHGPLKLATYVFDEIGELHDIVEHGPNFYAIDSITVSLQCTADERRRMLETNDTELRAA